MWLKFELIQAFMYVLVTCKNEEDPIINEGARVFTNISPIISLWRFFSDAQRQLTLQSLVRSGRISNSSGMLKMSLLPESIKKIRSKMKALEWSQAFYHYNSMGAIRCHGNQSSNPIWPKNLLQLFPPPQ